MISESKLANALLEPPDDIDEEDAVEEGIQGGGSGYKEVAQRIKSGELKSLQAFSEVHAASIRAALLSDEQHDAARELDRFVVEKVKKLFPDSKEGSFEVQEESATSSSSRTRGRNKGAGSRTKRGGRKSRATKQAEEEERSETPTPGTKKSKRTTRTTRARGPTRSRKSDADEDASRRRGRPRKGK
mmetsp:Transcript_23786/g.38328  ORF Transcript_23786/g.38328 Transcript_23786/m.38328 type:complete len:187 (+) Transcript_23786:908-1468(+)